MNFTNKNTKYNVITLRPYSKEDRKEFWKFRFDDIDQMLGILCWVHAAWCISFVAVTFQKRTKVTGWKYLYKFAIEFLTVFIYLVGKRFKRQRVYLLILLYFGIEALFVI